VKKIFFKKTWVQPSVLGLFALFYFSHWYKNAAFNIYQGRQLRRAMEVLNLQLTWEFYVCFNIFLMCAVAALLWFLGRVSGHRLIGFLLALFALAVLPFGYDLYFHHIGGSPKIERNAHERARLIEALIEKTDWDYKDFRERTFIVGTHPEDEYQILFEQIRKKMTAPILADPSIDGILVINRNAASFLEYIGGDVLQPNWTKARAEIPPEYFPAGQKSVFCKVTQVVGSFEICIFMFIDPDMNPTWNNLGYPYNFQQPVLVQITKPMGSRKLEPDKWIFYKNDCANLDPACTIYFLVSSKSREFLEVTVLGDPLAMPGPTQSLSFKNLMLEWVCRKDRYSFRIASQLGIEPGPNGTFRNGFLTPYQTRLPLKCKNPAEIYIGANEGELPPFGIKWKSD
jgi:hypothetical protein